MHSTAAVIACFAPYTPVRDQILAFKLWQPIGPQPISNLNKPATTVESMIFSPCHLFSFRVLYIAPN